ncbi:MAG: hypothetical protein K9K63_12690, partial [Desulfotignum sp.]|nr:hypothetical protein [Desulfotignum sp.]
LPRSAAGWNTWPLTLGDPVFRKQEVARLDIWGGFGFDPAVSGRGSLLHRKRVVLPHQGQVMDK